MIQYVILEEMGVLSRRDLDLYCKPEGRLGCHPDYGNPGIEASTGSLGHGLSISVGMALAERGRKTGGVIYTVLSDGEVQEGSTWEAMMMASSLGCANLVAFVDNNDFQSLGRTSETHPSFYPLVEKFEAFGWETAEVDGHDCGRRVPGRHRPPAATSRSWWSARPPRARASATWRTCRSGTTARRARRNTSRRSIELEQAAS